MTYQQTLDYLYSRLPMFHRIGGAAYKADLDTTTGLCHHLGNPQQYFPAIHVAGTNGKGSVSHLLASVLQESGLKTGLYTSPHLKDFRERIRVNGKMIPKKRVCAFVEDNIPVFSELSPSFFEWTFALAMLYFSECKIDMAIIETGMGGRLDSTNICEPLLCIITNIGMDHVAFLGDTPEKIAREKAGIIKPGIPVIIGQTQAKPAKVFREIASERKAALSFADKHISLRNILEYPPHEQLVEFDAWHGNQSILKKVQTPLTGLYQQKNFKTVLHSVGKLQDLGLHITAENIYDGFKNILKNTGLMGRWSVLGQKPLVICDTGHNTDGLRAVAAQIKSLVFNHLHFVLGTVDDKDIRKMLQLLPRNASYYFCKADIPRGLDAHQLAEQATLAGLHGNVFPSVKDAYSAALVQAMEDDLIFICGSNFVVAEII
jgi:dihydrofolate synthase / folylpolyglutamate synthase